VKAERSVKAHLVREKLFPTLGCFLAIVPARTNYSCHHQRWYVPDLEAFHHPPPQTWYVGFSTSSWLAPVRGAHHGKGVRYFALYSVHMGVPVQQKEVSHRALRPTSGCIYWKKVVPSRMSYAGQVPDRISLCQTYLRIGACTKAALVLQPNAVLTDRRQYTQAAGTRSKISRCFRERPRSCWVAVHTMVYFAPLLGAFVCA
jgi:hypothetical protein